MSTVPSMMSMISRIMAAAMLVNPVAAASGPMQFPKKLEDVELDIVGLLAVVGEAAMANQVQPITASLSCVLPRLVPAPQSFLRTGRPWRLPPNNSAVVGVVNGNYSPTLNYFPELLHGIDHLPRFAVQTIALSRRSDRVKNAQQTSEDDNSPYIYVRRWGPMNLLALIGMAMSAGLIVAASILKDGMALIAIILLSATSSIVGLANYWTVDLQKRTHSREVPDGDVVVIGRQGAFLIVRCDEKVARELYFGQEQCKYKFGDSSFRFFAGTGTFLFMAAVVFLASGTWAMQAAIGLSYICLNGAYWLVAALIPGKYQWDLRAYEIRDDMEQKMVVKGNFTAAIWHAIYETKSARWVRTAKLIPDTDAWKEWLDEAQVHAEADKDKVEWDAQKRLTEIIKDHMKNQPKGLQPAQTV